MTNLPKYAKDLEIGEELFRIALEMIREIHGNQPFEVDMHSLISAIGEAYALSLALLDSKVYEAHKRGLWKATDRIVKARHKMILREGKKILEMN